MNELTQLAEFISALRPEDIPEPVKSAAVCCVEDTVGTAIGAWKRQLLWDVEQMMERMVGKCEHEITVWGTGHMLSLPQAVLMNAMAGHSLELDDVHTKSKTHIGTVVIPAAWGLAEYLEKSPEELLTAVVCGYEVMARIGMALGVSSHRNKGWHVTSTAGTFGAAAACGKLLGLTAEELVWALGMAGTQSCGVWAFLSDGANCKILNPGRAAVSGLDAALFAKAGMSGSRYILEAEDGGLLKAMTDQADISKVCAGLGTEWEILQMDRKPYPCCRSTHCAIDAARGLRERCGFSPEKIERVQVFTYLVGNKQCGMSAGSRNPENAVEAKFSTPFTAACALLYGQVTEDSFTDQMIGDGRVRALLKKITVETDETFTSRYPQHWGCRMVVYLQDGTVLEQEIEDASGSVGSPLTKEQLKEKAFCAVRPVLKERTQAVMDGLENLANQEKLPLL